jgi:hypothetical protein
MGRVCSHAVAVWTVSEALPSVLLLQPNTTAYGGPRTTPSSSRRKTDLQHLQLYVSPRQKLLDFTRVRLGNVLAEGILSATNGVLSEVVCGELVSLAQELAVLCRETVSSVYSSAANCGVARYLCRAGWFRVVRDGLTVPESGL